MSAQPKARLVARLRDPALLRDALEYNGLTIRELSERCGSLRHRGTIGHLHSGARSSCPWPLAGRIERVLRMPKHSLFSLGVTTHHVDITERRRPAA